MVNKRSPYYLKSEYSEGVYGNERHTAFEREIKVKGNDDFRVGDLTKDLKSKLMP